MNRLTFPMRYLKVTQTYTGSLTHKAHNSVTPRDWPIDIAGYDSGRDWCFCPCNEMAVVRIYGVGNSKKSNTIWLTSTSMVDFADGTTDFVTMSFTHPNDEDLKKYSVGTKFRRGDYMFREGTDGNATGNHIHLSIGKGSIVGNGWTKNGAGAWVLTTAHGPIKPEQAMYVDRTFTTVLQINGLNFKDLPRNPYTKPAHSLSKETHCCKAGRAASNEVRWVQYELQRLGYYTDTIDGWFGPKTKEAVLAFQNAHKHTTYSGVANGGVGPITVKALEVS